MTTKKRPGAGNRSERRGHRSRKALLNYEGSPVLRLAAPSPTELEQLRAWAKDASAEELEAARLAVRSLLYVVEGEQESRFQVVVDAEDMAEGRRILDELRDA